MWACVTPVPQEGSYYYKIASIKGSVESALSKPVSVTFIVDGLESHLYYEDNNLWFMEER